MSSWSDTFSDKQARGDQWTVGWMKVLESLRGMMNKRESRERSEARDKRTVVENPL
ncbi:hypothetical protein DPMN_070721 [Dreissena polymorpha]|uniref:Uncharacterized protein n=1 Tax=Dreissena polymorpha TaxID=45954 RepID=A0A9D3Z3L5_DREPO|nr:hypothetical protein DPMN_070721 [Dreissena polymorpha]